MNLFMQKLAELENQYNIDKQALREARQEIIKAESFAAKHQASAVVCVHNGTAKVWVSVGRDFFVMVGRKRRELPGESIAGKDVFIVDGVKVILNDY
jgi:hypothetical protein